MNHKRAFTLIELLIVIGIIGIISTIGYGVYTDKVKASYRAEAQSALLQFQQVMERFYTENNSYDGSHASSIPLGSVFPSEAPLNSNDPKYDLTITTTTSSYTLTATPIDGTLMESDGNYTLTNTGVRTYKGENGWD